MNKKKGNMDEKSGNYIIEDSGDCIAENEPRIAEMAKNNELSDNASPVIGGAIPFDTDVFDELAGASEGEEVVGVFYGKVVREQEGIVMVDVDSVSLVSEK